MTMFTYLLSHRKINGWRTNPSFWGKRPMFTGELLVVGNVHLVDLDIKYGYVYIASYMDPSWFSKNVLFLSNRFPKMACSDEVKALSVETTQNRPHFIDHHDASR